MQLFFEASFFCDLFYLNKGCRKLRSASCNMDAMTSKRYEAQCGNFKIFLLLRFYVKSILRILEVQNLPLLPF